MTDDRITRTDGSAPPVVTPGDPELPEGQSIYREAGEVLFTIAAVFAVVALIIVGIAAIWRLLIWAF